MESRFELHEIGNIFQRLSDEEALYVLGLSLIANDLASNVDSIKRYPEGEAFYFFSNSISIIRELASLLVKIQNSELKKRWSSNTNDHYGKLKDLLIPFDEGSITKSVLKPIRDMSFHYNFNSSNARRCCAGALSNLKNSDTISVGFAPDKRSLIGQRYLFADGFRSNLANQFLTSDLTSTISSLAVTNGLLVDSLINDLLTELNGG